MRGRTSGDENRSLIEFRNVQKLRGMVWRSIGGIRGKGKQQDVPQLRTQATPAKQDGDSTTLVRAQRRDDKIRTRGACSNYAHITVDSITGRGHIGMNVHC